MSDDPAKGAASIDTLLGIMARLRDPQRGCPWDVAQTFASIAPYTIEEAYEVADAIDRNDMAALKDELGDLLLQVVFHARMAEEAGAFAFGDVVAAISDKMWRRHPHVFGDATVADARGQTIAWEAHKKRERGDADPSALAGIASGLPEWQRALKLHKRAATTGFDWPDASSVLDKLEEEIGEIRAELAANGGVDRLTDEVGDLLFVSVNLSRQAGVDLSTALRHANRKFERRFRAMERLAAEDGVDFATLDLPAQENYWQRAKAAERSGIGGDDCGEAAAGD
jgi:ATP diphosphatase